MSIVYNSTAVEVPGFKSISYLEDPKVSPQITDFDARKYRVRAIVIHTTSGSCAKGVVLPGRRPTDDKAAVEARYQTRSSRSVSWDFTVGRDAVILCQNDTAKNYSWHATSWNNRSIGFELVQNDDGSLYADQIAAAVALIDTLTRLHGIQRQIPWDKTHDKPVLAMIDRADEHGAKGLNMVGVFAHVNNTKNRGPGDPGPAPFRALKDAGYECFDFQAGEDLTTWKARQTALGFAGSAVDGIALTDTVTALTATGKKHGLWIAGRPGD